MKHDDVKFYLDVAKLAASRSKAIRLKVGGVVVDSNSDLVAFGYNGTPRGFSNECERKEYAAYADRGLSEYFPLIDNKIDSTPYRLVTNDNVIHCEANLVAHAARRGISINGGTVLLTHSPCEHCASLLYQAGIKVVFFIEKFRTFDDMFRKFSRNISFYQYDEKEDTVKLL